MVARVRTQDYGTHIGYQQPPFGNPPTTRNTSLGNSHCLDTTGNRKSANGLSISHDRVIQVGSVSGYGGAFHSAFTEWPIGSNTIPGHLTLPSSPPSSASAATDVLARTNPSRAEVSIPNFIVELREFPKMLFKKGRNHQKKFKTGNRGDQRLDQSDSVVEFNFGWDLLMKDLAGMFNFTDHVNKRVKELNGLYHRNGLRRRRTTWSDSLSFIGDAVVLHSTSGFVNGRYKTTTEARQWVTTQWKPNALVPIPSADELLWTAKSTVHGWSGPHIFLWNALPWSWFADYFVNVGDFLSATNNSVGAVSSNTCVMTQKSTTREMIITSSSDYFSVSPGRAERVTKLREPTGASLVASWPFLTTKQLLTLSSIALNR